MNKKIFLDGMPVMLNLSLSGDPQNFKGYLGGTYFLQEDTENGKLVWINQIDNNAIWWNIDTWMVGSCFFIRST